MKKIILILMLLLLIIGCAKKIEEKQQEITTEPIEESKVGITEQEEVGDAKAMEQIEPKETPKLPNLLKWKKEGLRIQNGVSPFIIIKDNEYYMYYPNKDIMLAKSKNGLNFDKGRIVLEEKDYDFMISNPAVIKLKNGKYRMFYERQNMEGIRHRVVYSAISNDGEKWEIEGERFFDYGDGKPDEKFTSVPDIIRLDDGTLRMYYCRGISSAIAESKDEGLTWKKIKNIDLDVYVLDQDIVRLEDGTYKLFFCTTDDPTLKKQWIALANSKDGINFELEEEKLLMPDPAYNNIVDPEVIKINDKYRMYYGQAKDPKFGFSIMSAVTD